MINNKTIVLLVLIFFGGTADAETCPAFKEVMRFVGPTFDAGEKLGRSPHNIEQFTIDLPNRRLEISDGIWVEASNCSDRGWACFEAAPWAFAFPCAWDRVTTQWERNGVRYKILPPIPERGERSTLLILAERLAVRREQDRFVLWFYSESHGIVGLIQNFNSPGSGNIVAYFRK